MLCMKERECAREIACERAEGEGAKERSEVQQKSHVSRFAALGIPLSSLLFTGTRTEVLERHRPACSCIHARVRRRVRAVRACGACGHSCQHLFSDARLIAPNTRTSPQDVCTTETGQRQRQTDTKTATETNVPTRQDRDKCIHTHTYTHRHTDTHTHTHTHTTHDTRSPRRTSSLGGGGSSF